MSENAAVPEPLDDEFSARERDEFSERLLGAIGTALIVRGGPGEIIVWNAAAERMLGWSAADVLGSTFHHLGIPLLDDVADVAEAGLNGSAPLDRELILRCADGHTIGVLAQASRIGAGPGGGAVIMLSDLTHRIQAEQKLRATQEQTELLLQHSADMIALINPTGTITFVNSAITELASYEMGDLIGSCAFDFVHPDDHGRVRSTFRELLQRGGDEQLSFRFRTKHGGYRWMEGRAVNLLDERNVRGVLVALHDVTQRVENESQLAYQATHDVLTGLPNRALFLDRLNHHIEHASRHGSLVAVLFWDVDNFKGVNDDAGHAVGDRVLVEVATRASGVMRGEDMVARLGGDEFVACAEVENESQACALAERLLDALTIEVTLPNGRMLDVTASVGLAFGAAPTVEAILAEADRAMYHAKRSGGRAITVLSLSAPAASPPAPVAAVPPLG